MILHRIEWKKPLFLSGISFAPENEYLFLLSEGRTRCCFEAEDYYLEAQGMVFCKPGQRLSLKPEKDSAVISYYTFGVNSEEVSTITSLPLPERPCPTALYPLLANLVQNMYFLFLSGDRYRMEKEDLYIRVVLYSIASGDEEPPEPNTPAATRYRLRQLQKALSDDPKSFPTVASAAAYVGLSESWFKHLYRQYFGISFSDNLIHIRIDRACKMLWSTDWPIERISHELGYNAETLFYRQFRRHMSMTPSEYRQQRATSF